MNKGENQKAKSENRGTPQKSKSYLWIASFALLAFLFLVPPQTFAEGRAECGAVRSATLGRAVKYCAILPPSYDTGKTRTYPVLYWLHGLGENEQTFVDFGGWNLVENLQEKKHIGEYIIVIPDGGRSFYINSHNGKMRYEDFFIREFLPAVEKKFRTKSGRANRGIAGVSMGGYGALRFAFEYPNLFSAVSVHSAALLDRLPQNLPTQSRGMQRQLLIVAAVFGMPVDAQFWEKNNPIQIARTAAGLNRLKIYFDCGTEDEYGFDRGAQALSDALKSRGIAHEFHLYRGGHGWAYLSEHAHASFGFQSRGFGLKVTP